MPLAIGVVFASANKISASEWKDKIEKLILKYRKCPDWYRKNLLHRTNQQNKLIHTLCNDANVDCSRPLTICDIRQFEELLCVDILVVSARLGNRFIRVPTVEDGHNKQRLYLYLVEYESAYHFHVIQLINAFYSKSKNEFCENCLKPCNSKHQCATHCFVCKRKDCCIGQRLINKKQSMCERWLKCTNCKQIIDRNKYTVEEHVCDTYLCKSCDKMVDTNSHNCYIRSCKPRENKPRFVFYDFECVQDSHDIQCEEGYIPTNVQNCSSCIELKTRCSKCSVCKNCQRTDCGKQTHAPNSVVATTVCEMCIDEKDFSPDSKCAYCGTRCDICDKFDKKENCYEKTPLREIVFSSDNTKHDFGKGLFSSPEPLGSQGELIGWP